MKKLQERREREAAVAARIEEDSNALKKKQMQLVTTEKASLEALIASLQEQLPQKEEACLVCFAFCFLLFCLLLSAC